MDQVSKGEITLSSTEDILTLALEKEEQSSRLRVVGLGVTKKQYFGASKSKDSATKDEVISLRSEVADLKRELQELRKHMLGQVQVQAPMSPPLNNMSVPEVDSNSPDYQDRRQELLQRCTLFWPNEKREVAKGRMFIPQGEYKYVLHGKELDPNEVFKVMVDTILPNCEEVSVPYPTDEITCLSDTPGCIIGWPTSLVVESNADSSRGSRISSRIEPIMDGDHPQPQKKSELVQKSMAILSRHKKFLVEIEMDKQILQHAHKLPIGNDELSCWLDQKEIEGVHVSFYIRFLYMKYKPKRHSFLCPARLSVCLDEKGNIVREVDDKYDMRTIYMASSMCQSHASQPLWLAPYNSGNHWVLAMINPHQSKVYWLDPLRGKIPEDFAKMCAKALHTFQMKVLKSKPSTISWKTIKKCPLQPNQFLCGFFICRMMRDIVQSGATTIPESYLLGSSDSYSQEQIDEVSDEWLGHLEPFLQMAI